MNIIWASKYVPQAIINLIFQFKNDIILFIDISKLPKNDLPPIKIKSSLSVIDLTLDGIHLEHLPALEYNNEYTEGF